MSERHEYRKYPFLLKRFTVTSELLPNIEEILVNCKKLTHLQIGKIHYVLDEEGKIWNGDHTINDEPLSQSNESSDDEGDDDEFELDPKLISYNSHKLKSLTIGSGLQFCRQPFAPPTLDQLMNLERISLCPIRPGVRCDRSRDEWNLRILAQSSEALKVLDLRGCYLKVFSLGWLKARNLQSLHMFYQVPAVSVLDRWSCTLEYLTLAKVTERIRAYRSMGPDKPGQELDACLLYLATDQSRLKQLDLHESDCNLAPLKVLVGKCKHLVYLDTRGCHLLPDEQQGQFKNSTEIMEHFT